MAIVTRRYVAFAVSPDNLTRFVGGGSAVVNGSLTWAEIQYDDATPGITETLDEYMASLGLVLDDDAGKGGIRVRQGDLAGTPVDIRVDAQGNIVSTATVSAYDCDSSIAVGEAVYLSAANTVDRATASDAAKAAIGIVASKPTSTTAIVFDRGEVGGYVGLTVGASYFLDTTPGGIVAGAPPPSGVIVQRVGFARNSTTLVVQIV